MSADATLVRCQSVSHRYRDSVQAVRDVDCSVQAGMRVALTGPSGSGKSTLLHLMAGLHRPSSGSVRWPGLDERPVGYPGRVAVVFQSPSLLPELAVVENVALPLLFADITPHEATSHAHEALDRLDLGGLAGKLPQELSGGQAQRVALARALVVRPSVILADEPTGQLDRATGTLAVGTLLAVADELGAAVVVATHDPLVAQRLDEQWRMQDGRLTTVSFPATPEAGARR